MCESQLISNAVTHTTYPKGLAERNTLLGWWFNVILQMWKAHCNFTEIFGYFSTQCAYHSNAPLRYAHDGLALFLVPGLLTVAALHVCDVRPRCRFSHSWRTAKTTCQSCCTALLFVNGICTFLPFWWAIVMLCFGCVTVIGSFWNCVDI